VKVVAPDGMAQRSFHFCPAVGLPIARALPAMTNSLSVPPFSYRSAQLFISVNPVRSHLERIREQTLLRRRSELTPLEKARQSGVEREVLGP